MVKRVCQVIKVKPERFDEYCVVRPLLSSQTPRPTQRAQLTSLALAPLIAHPQLHAQAWPGILKALERAHFTNYSIFHYAELSMLVGYWEWTGEDWEADMESVARDEETRRWWQVTDGLQESLVS